MSGVSNLYDACDELLGAASQACVLAPGGMMERVYVSAGVPPWDCPDQLTVHAGPAVVADTAPLAPPLQPGRRIQEGAMLNLVTLTITALRCVPTMQQNGEVLTLPTAAELDDAAKVTLGDLWAIWNHLATLKRNGSLFPPATRELFFDSATPVLTQGGIGGWQIPVRVQVDGYKTA